MKVSLSGSHILRGTYRSNGRATGRTLCVPDDAGDRFPPQQGGRFMKQARSLKRAKMARNP